jgi:hypothetical protein
MVFGALIIFNMLNGTAKTPEEPDKLGNYQRTIFKSLSAKLALNFPPFYTTAPGNSSTPFLDSPSHNFSRTGS